MDNNSQYVNEQNPQTAIESSQGKYKDAVADNSNTGSKLPQQSLPQAPDPSPFTLGPMTSGQR